MELGLLLFMTGIGVSAGATIVDTFRTSGPVLALCGALITIFPVMIAFVYGLPQAEKIWEWVLMQIRKNRGTFKSGDKSNLDRILSSNHDDPSFSQPHNVGGDRGLFRRLGIVFSTIEKRRRVFYVLLFFWILAGHIWKSPSPNSLGAVNRGIGTYRYARVHKMTALPKSRWRLIPSCLINDP